MTACLLLFGVLWAAPQAAAAGGDPVRGRFEEARRLSEEGRFAEALAVYDEVAAAEDGHPLRPYALHGAALTRYFLRDREGALADLRRLLDLYPSFENADAVRRKVAELEGSLRFGMADLDAFQEAWRPMEVEADYATAAVRLEAFLEGFHASPKVPEAARLLVDCYRRLGRWEDMGRAAELGARVAPGAGFEEEADYARGERRAARVAGAAGLALALLLAAPLALGGGRSRAARRPSRRGAAWTLGAAWVLVAALAAAAWRLLDLPRELQGAAAFGPLDLGLVLGLLGLAAFPCGWVGEGSGALAGGVYAAALTASLALVLLARYDLMKAVGL
ncbi:MAG: hypothetical protein HY722_14730 [Planctomycetes bacterium]|nr:hypothetical protein [Planctomycetota bacterium]